MQPTKQTILHDPANGKHGNCFSAVLASLLHLPIDDVSVSSNPSSWQLQLNEWLRPYGLCYMQIGGLKDWIDSVGIVDLHHEQAGNTLRSNDVLHSVVAVDCGPIFDPHPDDTGLTNNVANGVFVSLTPWVAASGASRIAELEQQLEAARKDAERYRWLASHEQWHVEYGQFNNSPRWFRMVENGDSWGQRYSSYDAAIDAAIAASKPAGGV